MYPVSWCNIKYKCIFAFKIIKYNTKYHSIILSYHIRRMIYDNIYMYALLLYYECPICIRIFYHHLYRNCCNSFFNLLFSNLDFDNWSRNILNWPLSFESTKTITFDFPLAFNIFVLKVADLLLLPFFFCFFQIKIIIYIFCMFYLW